MYHQTTKDIHISVEPYYLEEQSNPLDHHYFWAYHVRIENQGPETVQLLTRFWKIIDARGQLIEVQGDGVLGQQPSIEPGDTYEYTSGTPLTTPSGFMQGSYQMVTPAGAHFDVQIPNFSLDSPYETQILN